MMMLFESVDDSPGSYNTILGANVTGLSSTLSNNIIIADGQGNQRINVDGTGNVGIGTTTPGSKLTVVGDITTTGDFMASAGTAGFPSFSFTADSNTGLFNQAADNLGVTVGGTERVRFSTTNLDVRSGGIAFLGTQQFIVSGTNNLRLGEQAGDGASGQENNLIGYRAGQDNTGSYSNISGFRAGEGNTGSYNNIFGWYAGNINTGQQNNILGYEAGLNNTGGDFNNLFGTRAGYQNTGDYNEMIGFESGRNARATNSVFLGAESYRGGAGTAAFTVSNNVAIGYRAGYNATTTANNNILLGYQAADNLTTGNNNIVIGYDIDSISATADNVLNIGNLIFGTGVDGTGTTLSSGNIGIGTTTPDSRLVLERLAFTGSGTAGLNQYIRSTNNTLDAVQFGSQLYMYASNTATTTMVGSISRIADNTTFGNTVRGFEVQTDRGTNTQGENTALSGFARTFGVRGVTEGDAGAVYEPAGVFGETQGTTQGNAIRGYSSTITSASLLKLFQDTSAFTGAGLLMNFGNSGGSFSSTTASRFIDLQNAGSSMFTVGAYGMTTIGDGTTVHNAGLQIGYGGLCVDNDGSCNASPTGRINTESTVANL